MNERFRFGFFFLALGIISLVVVQFITNYNDEVDYEKLELKVRARMYETRYEKLELKVPCNKTLPVVKWHKEKVKNPF